MRKINLILLALLFMGCSGKSLLQDIPFAEFDNFEYHRAGNFSSVHIIASDAVMDGDLIIIDNVSLQADYGPFVNFNIKLEGYSRERVNDIDEIDE